MSDVTIALGQGPSWPGNRDKVNETLVVPSRQLIVAWKSRVANRKDRTICVSCDTVRRSAAKVRYG